MFSGIVQAVGRIVSVKPFVVDAGRLPLADVRAGDSICVQGACLTVTKKRGRRLSFDVSQGGLVPGSEHGIVQVGGSAAVNGFLEIRRHRIFGILGGKHVSGRF